MMIHSMRWPRRPFWSLCVLSLLPDLAFAASRAVPPISNESAVIFDGVVVAPQEGLAFVMRPAGGIQAVDLATGAVRWRSDDTAKPLALVGDRLIAQADGRTPNALVLVALDSRNGNVRGSSRMPLPAGVTASVVDPPGGSFRVRADRADSQLILRWQASGAAAGSPAQGFLPTENADSSPAIQDGEAVVGLSGSTMTIEPRAGVNAMTAAATAQQALEELSAPAVNAQGRQWRSIDGRHVLVSRPVETSEFTLYRHRWTVYEARDGARLGSLQALVSATPFLVVGETLFHVSPAHVARQAGKMTEHPMTLRAVNLRSGVEVWKAAVLDSSFRGPFPP